MEKFYATVTPGLEDISAAEIEELGGKITEIRKGKGRVFFEGKKKLIPVLNYFSRTLERVVLLLRCEKFENLSDIYRIVKDLDFSFIDPNQTFAIRCLRVGTHDFTSIDVGRVAGQAVIDSYLESKNVRLKVNLDEPDVIIRVDVINDEVFIGIDTTGDDGLHKRGYRVYNHPAPLNPTIAASLVKLSGWNESEILVDPMCGSATILIEAAMIGRNLPPGRFRSFAFEKIYNFDYVEIEESLRFPDLKIIGIEKFRKHLKGAKENIKSAEVEGCIELIKGDATLIGEFIKKCIDVVITNPPYGLRIGRKKIIEDLYCGFLKSLRNVIHNDSRIVVITAEDKIFKSCAEDYKIEKELKVKYGGLDTTVFVLKR